jgi:hypothetical protein
VVHLVEHTQELCLKTVCKENIFEMAVIGLPECKITVVCIYRAPDGNFREFLRKLEVVIQKLSMKGKHLILC